MTYQETIDYLFATTPVYQQIGGSAYKPGLGNVEALDVHYGHPHRAFRSIHVAGTNGKGSTSHTLAAILQSAGYRVGLFTSPHLVDFRERIRVNGREITPDYVVRFTEEARACIEQIRPSFFELTTMMALCYFRDKQVDIAVIEVGLGGRLDSTNIITPMLSVITNISLDHMQFLGNTLEEIAREKAGIIKPSIPVVVGNGRGEGVRTTIEAVARACSAPIYWAEESSLVTDSHRDRVGWCYTTEGWGQIQGTLAGEAQRENAKTILTAVAVLSQALSIPTEAVHRGFAEVTTLTGLRGRWEILSHSPLVICDTGHNEAGIALIVEQLEALAPSHATIRVVLGMAADKDVSSVLALLPRGFVYYFAQAQVARALPATTLATLALPLGLSGQTFDSIPQAYEQAIADACSNDLVFVGGSNFVVADLLIHLSNTNSKL